MKKILVINAGSATLKFKLFNLSDLKLLKEGIVERIGLDNSFLKTKTKQENYPKGLLDHSEALSEIINFLKADLVDIELVGHRVVHGGNKFNKEQKLLTKRKDK
jgi:acetate kinase